MTINKLKKTHNPEKTRQALLEAAADEIWRVGFRAASLSAILKAAGVTKGALYHHFGNKQQLGYAVVDELLRESIYQTWIRPIEGRDDPIAALFDMTEARLDGTVNDLLKYGCPLGNLAVEMSPIDEEFRIRVEAVFQEWRDALRVAFVHGQSTGTVKSSMHPARAASFIVSTMEGAICTAKSLQDASIIEDCLQEFSLYISLFWIRKDNPHN
jgi:AcrR family transcriptional regulator